MDAYAVIETGGKQYRVKENDTLTVETLQADEGAEVELDQVLAVSDGKSLVVGKPLVEGAKVTATVVSHKRGDKVVNFKKKRRKGYSRKIGHRQNQTVLKVKSLGA